MPWPAGRRRSRGGKESSNPGERKIQGKPGPRRGTRAKAKCSREGKATIHGVVSCSMKRTRAGKEKGETRSAGLTEKEKHEKFNKTKRRDGSRSKGMNCAGKVKE